ncbi:MAG: hypothetical protein ACI4UX_05335 [Clostridia bacterium]
MKGVNVKMTFNQENRLNHSIGEIASIASKLTPEERNFLAQRLKVLIGDIAPEARLPDDNLSCEGKIPGDPFNDGCGWDGK